MNKKIYNKINMNYHPCHQMPKKVFEVNDIKWFGANIYTFPEDKKSLIISLAGESITFNLLKHKNLILIEWEDNEPLHWNKNQWINFIDYIEKMNFKKIYVGV